MPVSTRQPGTFATAYTITGAFIGAAAGGGWLGLVLFSLAGLYGGAGLFADFPSLVIAGGAVAGLAYLCGRAAAPHGRLAGLRVVLVAAVATLNVAAALYFFGEWVCQISPAKPGPAFTECRIPAPVGGLSLLASVLLLSPAVLAATIGAAVTIRKPSTLQDDKFR